MAAPRALNIIKCAVSSFVNFFPPVTTKAHEIYTRAVDFRRGMPYFSLSRLAAAEMYFVICDKGCVASIGIISSPFMWLRPVADILTRSQLLRRDEFLPGWRSCQHFLIFCVRPTENTIADTEKRSERNKGEKIRWGIERGELNAHVSPQQKGDVKIWMDKTSGSKK